MSSKSMKAPPGDEDIIVVRDLVKTFNGRTILDGINVSIKKGDVLVIMGGSGCGKSTLLRQIIGLAKPDSGEVWVRGQEIAQMEEKPLAELRKKFGMLFQSGALFNSMTVGENVSLPILEHTKLSDEVVNIMVKIKLELVGLTGFEHLMPAEISGGMKKRVALARAIALDPDILFCDEPSAGLDPVMTAVVDTLMVDLSKKLGMTLVVVTHDMTSAFRIATKMVMLFQGKLVASGTPEYIRKLDNPILKQFINGEADGPIPLRLSSDDYLKNLLG
jgi:phospholipid/cholesterol/gamma-HCH transport system ATP-binding protein